MKAKSKKEQEWKFPCLGESEHCDLVVLFEYSKVGTVVLDDRSLLGHRIGMRKIDWIMSEFHPLTKSTRIILQND